MRTLKFIVEDQIIKQDPNCDFSDLVPGTEGYLRAEFSFSREWLGFAKVIGFYSLMGTEYEPQSLDAKSSCVIPREALARHRFYIQVMGRHRTGTKLKTNKVMVHQNGGK